MHTAADNRNIAGTAQSDGIGGIRSEFRIYKGINRWRIVQSD